MACLVKDFSFPIFTFVIDTEIPSDGHFLCLCHTKKTKNGQFCGQIEQSFDSMLQHLAFDHNCPLEEIIDYCSKCKCIFESKLMAVSHWLTHIIELEEKAAILEPYDEGTINFVLNPLMTILKQQREIVLQHLLFEGEDPCINEFKM